MSLCTAAPNSDRSHCRWWTRSLSGKLFGSGRKIEAVENCWFYFWLAFPALCTYAFLFFYCTSKDRYFIDALVLCTLTSYRAIRKQHGPHHQTFYVGSNSAEVLDIFSLSVLIKNWKTNGVTMTMYAVWLLNKEVVASMLLLFQRAYHLYQAVGFGFLMTNIFSTINKSIEIEGWFLKTFKVLKARMGLELIIDSWGF